MRRLTSLILSFFFLFLSVLSSGCTPNKPSENISESLNVPFYRKVAREVQNDGWVFSFVNNGLKEEDADDSDSIKYQFFGINIRYRYDDRFIKTVTQTTDKGTSLTQLYIPGALIWGNGSEGQERDMKLVSSILDNTKTVEELLALNPADYTFEELDKDMFFRLMKTALTSDPQKEGTDQSYWDKPTYAILTEPAYLEGYKFQVAFMQETGCVDELYIDVLYQTGDEYDNYIQLSDLVDSGTATPEQEQAFRLLQNTVKDIKECESFITNAESYRNQLISEIDFSRLYTFLEDIHNNNFELYYGQPLILPIEGIE